MTSFRLRGLFCLAAAVTAAALADPLVEAASNAGAFGSGTFTDHSTIDVLPAALAAAALAFFYILARVRPVAGADALAWAKALRASLLDRDRRRTLRLLPWAFAGQIGVLYGMETLEQLAVTGHPLGGALWLGAPAAWALALHALACVATLAGLERLLDALTAAAVDLALFVRGVAVRRNCGNVSASLGRAREPRRAAAHPLGARSGKRAPPFLAA